MEFEFHLSHYIIHQAWENLHYKDKKIWGLLDHIVWNLCHLESIKLAIDADRESSGRNALTNPLNYLLRKANDPNDSK